MPNPGSPSPNKPVQNPNKVPTPVNVARFERLLEGYDKLETQYLVEGLRSGFRLEFDEGSTFQNASSRPPTRNHDSATRHADSISKKIKKELDAGRLEGPFLTIPYESFQISPLAAVEKKEPGEYRLLHDLSFPEGQSVNDNIATEKGKTKYQSLDQVIDTIVELGSHSILSKFDIEHAYKILPIHPDDVPAMGFYWEGSYYFDKTLAMGCRTSAKIFERFTTALEWIMKNKFSLQHCHHVLDDFLLASRPQSVADHQFHIFLAVCKYLNIPIKVTKTDSGMIIVYLGIELDTIHMQSRLPQDKITKCIGKIDKVLSKDRVMKKTLESLAGLLNFACRVIRPGRAFLRRTYSTIAAQHHSYKPIRVSKSIKDDLLMWRTFLQGFNGVTMFPENHWSHRQVIVHSYTDAAPVGFGLLFGSKWLYGPFPPKWQKFNILFLEAYPVMLLFELFKTDLANKKIILHIDNEALVTTLNKQTVDHSHTMVIIRHIVLVALEYNIIFKAVHVPGVQNTLADPLSRLQIDVFKQRARDQNVTVEDDPIQVPHHLSPKHYKLT